jgi:hypothetical protein
MPQRTIPELKAAFNAAVEDIDREEAAGRPIRHLLDTAEKLYKELRGAQRDQAIRSIGRDAFSEWSPEIGTGSDLGSALLGAGFNLKSQPNATVDYRYALQMKAGSLDGGSDIQDAVPLRFTPAPLGLDARYLFPRIPTQGVDAGATGVSTYRQASRALASPLLDDSGDDGVVRDILATSTKAETDTVSEVVALPLKQIATISSQTPNVLLQNQNFRQWVNDDLLASYRAGVDAHIVAEIGSAGIGSGPGGGANTFEDILYAQEVVRAAGYRPDVVVVSPTDALSVQLTMLHSGDSYAFTQSAPTFVVSNAVSDGEGFVADAGSLGILFLSPFTIQAFEENAGSTNTSTVRAESNGLMVVQRPDAAATISATS